VPRLLVIKGADEGKQFELSDRVVSIGRDASSRIRLHDTEVSRRHAEIRHHDGTYMILDVGSANGTFVNNEKVQDCVLQGGDQVMLGQTTMVYSLGRAEKAEAAEDLADKIRMITRSDVELASAIIRQVSDTEGSRILAQADKASSLWLKANLTIMYEVSQAVSHILDIDELLARLLELVFRSINADRGCAMLSNPDTGRMEPRALKLRKETEDKEQFALSRTIMDYVLRERQGVLVSDARQDERFNTGQSIVRFGIREVICVPMKGRHETLGVLYLDTYSTPGEMAKRVSGLGKFTEDHLALASAVAHQAALALEETHYHQAMLQGERLAAIGQTIASLSHHIKNILQGLRSGNDIIKMGLRDHNETLIQQGWRITEKNQGKIYELVLDMLSYSKERIPAVEATDLNQVVKDVVELIENRAKEMGVKLEVHCADGLPVIHVDPEGLHRAVLNIVSNALDAVDGEEGGHVKVATQPMEDACVGIVVADNGSGIPAGKLTEIFKPFVSTKGARGTGLGLAVSRKIMREHGGDIDVESQEGKGSRFTLRLPIRSPFSQDPQQTVGEFTLPPELEL